jgi:hypothetical protein
MTWPASLSWQLASVTLLICFSYIFAHSITEPVVRSKWTETTFPILECTWYLHVFLSTMITLQFYLGA